MKSLVVATALIMLAATSSFAQDAGVTAGEIEMSVQQQGADAVPMILLTILFIAALTSAGGGGVINDYPE